MPVNILTLLKTTTYLIFIGILLCFSAQAQTLTPTPTPSGQVTAQITADKNSASLAGPHAGNIPSFEIFFDFSSIPANAQFSSVVLTYNQKGVSSGLVKILDKYSTSIIDSKGLSSEGSNQSNRIGVYANQWLSNPGRNLGLLFQASEVGLSEHVEFSLFTLDLVYQIPDNREPVITGINIVQLTMNSVILKVEMDEPAVYIIDYGKTSLYDRRAEFKDTYSSSSELNLTGLQSGVGYHYQLTAVDAAGNSTKSGDRSFSTTLDNGLVLGETTESIDPNMPAPKDLTIELTRQDNKFTVNIAWTAAPGDVDGYVIYKGFESLENIEEYKRIGVTTSYLDIDVLEDHGYYYFVRAFKGDRLSTKSDNQVIYVPKVPVEENALAAFFISSDTRVQLILIMFAVAGAILCAYYLIFKGTKKLIAKFSPKPGKTNVLKDPDFYN